MKILNCTEFIPPLLFGGGEKRNFETCKQLVKLGYNITTLGHISPNTKRKEIIDGVKIERTGLRCIPISSSYEYLPRIPSTIDMFFRAFRKDYDILFTNPFFSILASVIPARIRKKKIIVIWDDVFGWKVFKKNKGIFMGILGTILERIALFFTKWADIVLAVSEATKKKLIKYGIDKNRIHVVYNGINIDEFEKKPCEKIEKSFLYVGRQVWYKNIDDLIEAFSLVNKLFPETKLYIITAVNDIEFFMRLIKKYKLSKKVFILDRVSDKVKLEYMRKSIATILPSSFEGFGITLIEANASFRPFITYDIPATREVYNITKGGYLVKHRNIRELFFAMKTFLTYPKLASEIGMIGRKNVEKNFTWEIVAKRIDKIIKEIKK